MDEPIGARGVEDAQSALRREVVKLSQRFPEVPAPEVEHRVRQAFNDLHAQARVKSHLIALTSARVTKELLEARHRA